MQIFYLASFKERRSNLLLSQAYANSHSPGTCWCTLHVLGNTWLCCTLQGALTCALGNQCQVSNWTIVVASQVRVWDVNTLKCLATLTGHSGAVRALAASSKRVFSGSDDTTIKVRRRFLHYVNLAARPLGLAFAAPSVEDFSLLTG